MITENQSIVKRGILFVLIGVSVFLVYLQFVLGGVRGLAEIAARIQTANLFYYSLAFISIILSMLFSSLTWHRLAGLLSIRASFRKTFLYRWVGIFVDLLIPAESISGDLSRAYLMSKNSGLNSGKVMASVASHRILTMIITLGGLIISSLYFFLEYRPSEPVLSFVLVFIVSSTALSIVLIGYISVKDRATKKLVNWAINLVGRVSRGRWELTGLRLKADKTLKTFHQGIEILVRNPRGLAWPAVFSFISWLFMVIVSFFVFVSLDYRISLSAIIIVYSISASLENVPIGILGQVGVLEIIMTTIYTMLGVPVGVSVAATVLTRIVTVGFRLVVGFVFVQVIGIKFLKDIKQ